MTALVWTAHATEAMPQALLPFLPEDVMEKARLPLTPPLPFSLGLSTKTRFRCIDLLIEMLMCVFLLSVRRWC